MKSCSGETLYLRCVMGSRTDVSALVNCAGEASTALLKPRAAIAADMSSAAARHTGEAASRVAVHTATNLFELIELIDPPESRTRRHQGLEFKQLLLQLERRSRRSASSNRRMAYTSAALFFPQLQLDRLPLGFWFGFESGFQGEVNGRATQRIRETNAAAIGNPNRYRTCSQRGMIWSLALVIAAVASARAIAHCLAQAPVGYEDNSGFHLSPAPEVPGPSGIRRRQGETSFLSQRWKFHPPDGHGRTEVASAASFRRTRPRRPWPLPRLLNTWHPIALLGAFRPSKTLTFAKSRLIRKASWRECF